MKYFIFFFYLFFCQVTLFAQNGRQWISLDSGWLFHMSYDVRQNVRTEKVQLPHTWNASETLFGKMNYTRDAATYERKLLLGKDWKDKRLFLYFEGVNSFAQVLVNNHFATSHKGGYTAFCVEVTNLLHKGENTLTVHVSNAWRTDILPLTGDFNIYGGIHRPVRLLITDTDCITPLDYASPGVYIKPVKVGEKSAALNILTKFSIRDTAAAFSLKTTVFDANKNIVAQCDSAFTLRDNILQHITLTKPHLWNGKADPYLYQVNVQLRKSGVVIDEVQQPLGLRYYDVRADSGFFLNGKYMDLHGFGLHEDLAGKGSAMSKDDLEKDMSLVEESGANALRLTHYPHSAYFYDLADRNGTVLWSEIPLVGPGGYTGTGFVNDPELKQQSTQILTEMIRQNYNHPSVLFWGLFNELKLNYDDPIPFLKELDSLAHNEDDSRITTAASFLDNDKFNEVSDVIAWNKYYGWYGGQFSDIGKWADATHRVYPNKPFAVSEYGAGASAFQHTDTLIARDPGGRFHPEEWQTLYHEENWKALHSRPFIWGKFVWAMTDFGSSIRTEGDHDGINDKGLVTYDRKIKKDAFYFYKVNWNRTPMIYITNRRYIRRSKGKVDIKVYSNLPHVSLYLNGSYISNLSPDAYKVAVWKDISLRKGKNTIMVKENGVSDVIELMY